MRGDDFRCRFFSEMLNGLGVKATAITGAQAGFRTNDEFTQAKILEMKSGHLRKLLQEQEVLVVAGFQGQSKTGEVTTLGRGGSDTSAIALAAAVHAEWVDIFTDVNGVMTADPRIVADARALNTMTYNEICNMAYQGAKVIHPRLSKLRCRRKFRSISARHTLSKKERLLLPFFLK